MGEMFGGHEVVGFNDLLDVIAVNTDGDTHNHVLRSFCDFTIDSQEIGSLTLGMSCKGNTSIVLKPK